MGDNLKILTLRNMDPVSITIGIVGALTAIAGLKALHITLKSDCIRGSATLEISALPVEENKNVI